MIDARQEKSENRSDIVVGTELNISNAEELKNRIIEALASSSQVFVNIENVQDIDLAAMQLLCSAHKSALLMDKTFDIGEIPPPVRQKLVWAGYVRSVGCTAAKGRPCLWMKGC